MVRPERHDAFAYRYRPACVLLGRNPHPDVRPRGEGFVVVLMPEFFSDDEMGRNVRRRFCAVHPVLCLAQGDVAVYGNGIQLGNARWQQADKVEVRFTGHTGAQKQIRSVRVPTRNDVRGLRSSFGVNGGAVALVLELMSCFSCVPEHAPLSAYRCGKAVRKAVRHGRAFRAIKQVVAKSGRNPEEVALHSLPIGGATTLAAVGDMS